MGQCGPRVCAGKRRVMCCEQALPSQASVHVLHVFVGIQRGQEGLDLFELFGAEAGRVYRVFGAVGELGRDHGEALRGQGAADQVEVGGVGDEAGGTFFVADSTSCAPASMAASSASAPGVTGSASIWPT